MLDYDKVMNNPYTKLVLHFNDDFAGEQTIEGFVTDETFNIEASTNWGDYSDLVNSAGEALLGDMMQKIEIGLGLIGVSSVPYISSIAKWEGTEKPTFTVGMLFIAIRPSDRPQNNARDIVKRLYPKIEKLVQHAPMGYSPVSFLASGMGTGDGSTKGTCALKIGRWFSATNLLLANASFEMAKECISNGSPLYAKGSATFTTAAAISYEEYAGFFIGG